VCHQPAKLRTRDNINTHHHVFFAAKGGDAIIIRHAEQQHTNEQLFCDAQSTDCAPSEFYFVFCRSAAGDGVRGDAPFFG
jgi:hypothetical protein